MECFLSSHVDFLSFFFFLFFFFIPLIQLQLFSLTLKVVGQLNSCTVRLFISNWFGAGMFLMVCGYLTLCFERLYATTQWIWKGNQKKKNLLLPFELFCLKHRYLEIIHMSLQNLFEFVMFSEEWNMANLVLSLYWEQTSLFIEEPFLFHLFSCSPSPSFFFFLLLLLFFFCSCLFLQTFLINKILLIFFFYYSYSTGCRDVVSLTRPNLYQFLIFFSWIRVTLLPPFSYYYYYYYFFFFFVLVFFFKLS